MVDALGLGPSARKGVGVRVPLSVRYAGLAQWQQRLFHTQVIVGSSPTSGTTCGQHNTSNS